MTRGSNGIVRELGTPSKNRRESMSYQVARAFLKGLRQWRETRPPVAQGFGPGLVVFSVLVEVEPEPHSPFLFAIAARIAMTSNLDAVVPVGTMRIGRGGDCPEPQLVAFRDEVLAVYSAAWDSVRAGRVKPTRKAVSS